MMVLGVAVAHAISTQADKEVKGPYRWRLDKIVGIYAIEKLIAIYDV